MLLAKLTRHPLKRGLRDRTAIDVVGGKPQRARLRHQQREGRDRVVVLQKLVEGTTRQLLGLG